jgi:4-hydroxyphenylacetate 3-monooxygenase
MLALEVHPLHGERGRIELVDPFLVICGFTGSDAEQVSAHVRELEELGAEPPESTPTFMPAPAHLLQRAGSRVEVASADTSGEAEPVLVRTADGAALLAVGSDHTDRGLERSSILAGKVACPKVVSAAAWPLDEVEERWDRLILSAVAAGLPEPHQHGELSGLTRPTELLAALEASIRVPKGRPLVAFLGTIAGASQPTPDSGRFAARLQDPDTERTLDCFYDVVNVSTTQREALS